MPAICGSKLLTEYGVLRPDCITGVNSSARPKVPIDLRNTLAVQEFKPSTTAVRFLGCTSLTCGQISRTTGKPCCLGVLTDTAQRLSSSIMGSCLVDLTGALPNVGASQVIWKDRYT